MKRSAASLDAANTSLEQSVALVTSANTVLQNPESTGTIFKTLSARIRSATTELEELGEEEDAFTQSTSKLRDLIKGLTGFDILESDEQTFKSIYDILVGIGEKWDDLTDVEQASLGEALAGKRNANALYAILNNLDTLESAYETATNSAGSAMREQQNFEQGLEYSTNRLKASLEELAADTLNSDFLKGGIDAVNTLVQLFDKLISSVGTVSTLAAGLGAIFGGKAGLFSGSSEGLMFGGKTLGENKENKVYRGNLKTLSNNLKNAINYDPNTLMSSFSEEGLALWLGGIDKVDARTKALFDTYRTGGKTAQEALEAIQLELGKVGKTSGKFTSTLKGLFSSLGAGLLNAAISFGVSKLLETGISAIDHLVNKSKYIQQAAKESRDRIDEVNTSLKETTDLVDNSKQRYAELAQEVGNLGSIAQNQGTLSNEEYKEFLEISNQLAEKFPQLTKGYDDNGNAILNLSGSVDTMVNSLNELVKAEEQLANQKIIDELDTLWDAYVDNIDNYEKKLREAQSVISKIENMASGSGMIYDSNNKNSLLYKAADLAGLTGKLTEEMVTGPNGEELGTNYVLDWKALIPDEVERLKNAFTVLKQTYVAEAQSLENTITASGQDIGNSINAWAHNLDTYMSIEGDESLRNMFNTIVQNFDYSSFGDDLEKAKNALGLKLNSVFAGLNQTEYAKLRDEVFEVNEDETIPYLDKIEKLTTLLATLSGVLGGMNITELKELLGLDATFNSRQNVLDRWAGEKFAYNGPNVRYTGNFKEVDGLFGTKIKIPEEEKNKAYAEYEDFINGLNDKDFDLWEGALNDGNISEELYNKGRQAWEDYLATLQQVAEDNPIEVKVKASDAVNSMADAKSAFNSLESLYDQIVNKTEADGQATGFADPALINSVESAFSKFVTDDDAGQQLNAALENFEKTLVEFPNDAEKAQDAVDELVTAYIDQTDIIKNLTEENAEWSKAQLTAMGITNAEDVVMTRLNKTSKKLSEGLSKVTETLKANADALQESKQGTAEYEEAIQQLANDVAEMLSFQSEDGTISFDASTVVDSSFIEAHRADIDAMVEGDIDALNRVRAAAAHAAVMTVMVDMPTEAAEQQVNHIMDMVAQADAMNIDVGASIDDSAFLQALSNMVGQSQTMANAVSKAFETMGYNVKFIPNKYKMRVPSGGKVTTVYGGPDAGQAIHWTEAELDIPSVQITRAGTAGAKATYTPPANTPSGGGGGGGGGGGDNNSTEPNKPKEETEETFDWIAVAIQRLEEEETRLGKIVDNVYDHWEDRNEALGKQIDTLRKDVQAEYLAYLEYARNAEELQVKPLNDADYGENDQLVKAEDQRLYEEAVAKVATGEYQRKIREGQLTGDDIESISNHFLTDWIKEYQTRLNNAIQSADKVKDKEIELGDAAKKRFDLVKSEFDGLISLLEAKASLIEKRIDKAEAHGYFTDEKYYKQLMANNEAQYQKKLQEYNGLEQALQKALNEGSIKEGSEAWVQMTTDIKNCRVELEELTNQNIEYANSLRQIQWDKFDFTQERISRVASEMEFLNELIANEKMYEDDGQYTDYGQTRQGLYLMQYDVLVDQLRKYKDMAQSVAKDLADDPNNKKLIDEYDALQDAIWDTTKSIEGLQQSIKEHMVEAINTHLQYLDKLIDKYETALDKERDMFSYQKNIKSQVDNISHLERALNALSGDDSEEARRLRQTTQAELDKAKEQLEETEWDRMISNTKEAIADMRDSYEETLMEGMDNIVNVMERAEKEANENAATINSSILKVAGMYNYDLSDTMQEIVDHTTVRKDEEYYGVAAEIIKKGAKSSWGADSKTQNKNLEARGFDSDRVRDIIAEMQNERRYTEDMDSVYAGIAYNIARQGGTFWGANRKEQVAKLSSTFDELTAHKISNMVDDIKNAHDKGVTWAELSKKWGFNLDYTKYQTKWYGKTLAELGEEHGFNANKLNDYSKNNFQDGFKNLANYGLYLVTGFKEAWGQQGYISLATQEIRDAIKEQFAKDDKTVSKESNQIDKDINAVKYGIASEIMKKGSKSSWGTTSKEQDAALKEAGFDPEEIRKMIKELSILRKRDNSWASIASKYGFANDSSKYKKFAKGSSRIPHDQIAITQEDGSELIFRASDGSMLTPLGQGDMVFSNEMSQRLWEIAKNGVSGSVGTIKPVISGNAGNTINQENAISITLPNVTNYDEFKNALRKDTQFTNFVQEITVGQLAGNNTLRKNRY